MNTNPTKISTWRRRGDSYELHLFALKCIEMVLNSEIIHVIHEYRPLLPADDVIVEYSNRIECYQAKHAKDFHALLTLNDLVNETELGLNVRRLKAAWDVLRTNGKDFTIHIFTNRAADAELAIILDGNRVSQAIIENAEQKRKRESLKKASGISDDDEFRSFLSALRFELRKPNLDGIIENIKGHIEAELGLNQNNTFPMFIMHASNWFLEETSRPITQNEILNALSINTSTLPQYFNIDPTTLVYDIHFEKQLYDFIGKTGKGYFAITGSPGSGKSTFITKYVENMKKRGWPVIRYYCFTDVNDPFFRTRVSEDEFLKSMIEQINHQFGRCLDDEHKLKRYEYSHDNLYKLLEYLGAQFNIRGKKFLMVVDGIDHVHRADVEQSKKLLNVLPYPLPDGVICLIGTQSIQYLPYLIEQECTKRSFNIPLFNMAKIQKYLSKFAKIYNRIDISHFRLILEKSGGLPLYLRYIVEQILEIPSNDIYSIINNLPKTDHIDNYHTWIWNEIKNDVQLKHICSLASRIRFQITKEQLFLIAQINVFDATNKYNKVKHIFKETDVSIRVYHNSFREFVLSMILPNETATLDNEIYLFLKGLEDTHVWFENVFKYAFESGNYNYVTESLNTELVERAISIGILEQDIIDNLYIGIDAAVESNDPVALARICSLIPHTDNRFEHNIDSMQLQRVLFELKEVDKAISVISRDGKVYGTSTVTMDGLIELASRGHESVGRELAKSFFDMFGEEEKQQVDYTLKLCDFLSIYAYHPESYIAYQILNLFEHVGIHSPLETSGGRILNSVLFYLYKYGRFRVVRNLKSILFEIDKKSIQEDWYFQIARIETEFHPDKAHYHLFEAEKYVEDTRKRIIIAGLSAYARCDVNFVNSLLPQDIHMPGLENDSIRYTDGQYAFEGFRSLCAALIYCDRKEDIERLLQHLNTTNNWLAVYYRINHQLIAAKIEYQKDKRLDVNGVLSPISTLLNHRKGLSERVYEAFGSIRPDIIRLFEVFVDLYMSQNTTNKEILSIFQKLGECELIDYHFGIGLAVADYSNEIGIIKTAAEYPALHEKLKPILQALHEKIKKETLETATRTDNLLRLSETAAKCNYLELAKEWLLDGLSASKGYGYRKDITLTVLIDAVKVINKIDPKNARKRIADIADWNSWMHHVTDGAETKWFAHHLFDAVLEFDFKIATKLLVTYRESVGRWKFSDCLSELLTNYDGDNPMLAYVLSEVIDECRHDDGFKKKFDARLNILEVALKHNMPISSDWINKRLLQFLLCEVSPDVRIPLIREYNEIAGKYGFTQITITEGGMEKEKPYPIIGSTSSGTIEYEGITIKESDLYELLSISVNSFICITNLLYKANLLHQYERDVHKAAAELLQRAKTVSDVDRISGVVIQDKSFLSEIFDKVIDSYRRIGAHDKYLEVNKKAFECMQGWGLWSKRIKYLDPLIEHDKQQAMTFLIKVIKDSAKQMHYAGFGAAQLLVRSLYHFGNEHYDTALKIYDDFHRFVENQFSHIPCRDNSPYDWLRADNDNIESFEDYAFGLIFDEWKQPTFHRRISLTHLIRDLALQQSDMVMPQVIEHLFDDNITLKQQVSLVINAISIFKPEILIPYYDKMLEALRLPHYQVRQNLIEALENICQMRTIPEFVISRIENGIQEMIRNETDR